MSNKKKVVIGIIAILVLLTISVTIKTRISNMEKIDQVKRSCFSNDYPEVSTGDAFENYFANENWKCFEASTGEDVVEFSGKMMYDGEKVNARVQFIVEEDGTTIGAFSMNDIAQNEFVKSIIISTIIETYAMDNGIISVSDRNESTEQEYQEMNYEPEEETYSDDDFVTYTSDTEEEEYEVTDAEEEPADVDAIMDAEVYDYREYVYCDDYTEFTARVSWTSELKDQGYIELSGSSFDENSNSTNSFEGVSAFINDEQGLSYLYNADGIQTGKVFYENYVEPSYELVLVTDEGEIRFIEIDAY